ncbi:MAG: iron-sulfur cluster assembly accessory protein [Acidobacteriota bacterium]|nr:iron-sulfur cluster assembly accessory protein [Acidobacteriota bacterium]
MIEITKAASKLIHSGMQQEGIAGGGLRVGVKAGGCSGLSYIFKWEQTPTPDDEIFSSDTGATIYVDPKSFKYLDGTILDCDPNMLGQSLILRNPNAKSECGCGLSFGV